MDRSKSSGGDSGDTPLQTAARKAAERERLATRLRANLGRRKQQQRAREATGTAPEPDSETE